MLDAFASVGAIRFNLTLTTRAGEKRYFKRSVSVADLANRLPALLDNTTRQEINVIVRPYGPGVTFIQLDDLKPPLRGASRAVRLDGPLPARANKHGGAHPRSSAHRPTKKVAWCSSSLTCHP